MRRVRPALHAFAGQHRGPDAFERCYRNNGTGNRTGAKYREAVLELYADTDREAWRVLCDLGVLIDKWQDEVCPNRQRFTHVEIMQAYAKIGFIAENLFVVWFGRPQPC